MKFCKYKDLCMYVIDFRFKSLYRDAHCDDGAIHVPEVRIDGHVEEHVNHVL